MDAPTCGRAVAAVAAEGETPGEGAEEEAEHVVPVEELEAVARAELDGVCPGAPAEHGDKHQEERDAVGFGLVHGHLPEFFDNHDTANAVDRGC